MNKQIKKDIKMALILSSLLLPFPFLGIAIAPWWAWAFYFGWWALVCYANFRNPKKKRKAKKFQHFEIHRIEIDKCNLEETA